MLQVVRRDDHVCQICFKYARDDEIEFDHVIPVAREVKQALEIFGSSVVGATTGSRTRWTIYSLNKGPDNRASQQATIARRC